MSPSTCDMLIANIYISLRAQNYSKCFVSITHLILSYIGGCNITVTMLQMSPYPRSHILSWWSGICTQNIYPQSLCLFHCALFNNGSSSTLWKGLHKCRKYYFFLLALSSGTQSNWGSGMGSTVNQANDIIQKVKLADITKIFMSKGFVTFYFLPLVL